MQSVSFTVKASHGLRRAEGRACGKTWQVHFHESNIDDTITIEYYDTFSDFNRAMKIAREWTMIEGFGS